MTDERLLRPSRRAKTTRGRVPFLRVRPAERPASVEAGPSLFSSGTLGGGGNAQGPRSRQPRWDD